MAQPYELAHVAYAAAVASLMDRPMDATQQLLHRAFKYPYEATLVAALWLQELKL